jgi:hypothetical protein
MLSMLPEEYQDRKLIYDKDYNIKLSSPHLLNLNLEGGSNLLNTGLNSKNPGLILSELISNNANKEKPLISLLEKHIKVLSKANEDLSYQQFVTKNKISLKSLYETNFKIITKSYLTTEIINSYNSDLGNILSSLKKISPFVLLEMDKNLLLNANWELVSKSSQEAAIIPIPKDPYGTYEPFVFSYTLHGEISTIKTLTKLINNKKFISISENYLLNQDSLPLKLNWMDNSLVFNYNYKVIIDNKEYLHNLNFHHIFPSLKKVLNNSNYDNLYAGPLSNNINTDHFILSDVQGEAGLVRVTLPSEFNFTIPNSICYNRENLETKFNLNLRETDWLFDQATLNLEKFLPAGFILNIKLDKELLGMLGYRDYLNKVFYPALNQIESPFVNVVGNHFFDQIDPKLSLFQEEGLQLFCNDLFSFKLNSKSNLELISIIQNLDLEKEVPASLKITLINFLINDYPINQKFNFEYQNLSILDFLLKRGIILDENYLYLFLSKNNNFSKLISEAIEVDSSKMYFIKIPLQTPENFLNDSEYSPQSLSYLKKEIGTYTQKNKLSKSELELVKRLVNKIIS